MKIEEILEAVKSDVENTKDLAVRNYAIRVKEMLESVKGGDKSSRQSRSTKRRK